MMFIELFIVNTPLNKIYLFILAATLDYILGDPWGWPHPVRVMGSFISSYSQFIFNLPLPFSSLLHRLAGVVLAISLIAGSALTGWGIIIVANHLFFGLGFVCQVILLASCLAGRSLRAAFEDVWQPLQAGDIIKARQKLSNYVGRDTDNLSEPEIYRALLETITENAVDGVFAPLFYAGLGSLFSGEWAVGFALAYKAASTLDSMVGYKTPPYQDIGWFSAKLEDILTWFPCRLTVLTLGVISGKLTQVWQLCQRDAINDPSPNSGWSECVYAAILGVQLGGINYYQGQVKQKPLLGDKIYPITIEKIQQALKLTRYCFLLWLTILVVFFSWQFWQGSSLGI